MLAILANLVVIFHTRPWLEHLTHLQTLTKLRTLSSILLCGLFQNPWFRSYLIWLNAMEAMPIIWEKPNLNQQFHHVNLTLIFFPTLCNSLKYVEFLSLMYVSPSCYIVLTVFQILSLTMIFVTSKHVLQIKKSRNLLKNHEGKRMHQMIISLLF